MHKQMENLSRNENYKKGIMIMPEINNNKKTTTKSEMKNSFDYISNIQNRLQYKEHCIDKERHYMMMNQFIKKM